MVRKFFRVGGGTRVQKKRNPKVSGEFRHLKELYWRAANAKSEKAWEKAEKEYEALKDSLSEDERRTIVEMSVDAASRIGVKRTVLKLGKLGDVGRETENR